MSPQPRRTACLGWLPAGAALALALSAGTSSGEDIDPDEPLSVSAAGATWTLGNSSFVGVPGLGVLDAQLGSQVDAYDLAGRLLVDGVPYVAPTAIRVGRSYAAGPVELGGLEVSVRYVIDELYPVLGAVASFSNKLSAGLAATVTWENNIGADGDLEVATTSSGDDDLTSIDRWIVLHDGPSNGGPATWFLFFGRGEPRLVPFAASLETSFFSSNEGVRIDYDIDVAPGDTVSLLFLNGLADSTSRGVVLAANVDRFLAAEDLLAEGLSAEERERIVNFQLGKCRESPLLADEDEDGVLDTLDNCAGKLNPDQRDTDADGYGNLCDPDITNDGRVGVPDFLILSAGFGRRAGDAGYDLHADLDSDGVIGTGDFFELVSRFGGAPGPSNLSCAGNVGACSAACIR